MGGITRGMSNRAATMFGLVRFRRRVNNDDGSLPMQGVHQMCQLDSYAVDLIL